MRDADEDEETRVMGAGAAAQDLVRAVLKRQPGLPPPLIPAATEELRPLRSPSDDDITRLLEVSDPVERRWLVSDGPNAPLELGQAALLAELKAGKISRQAFAWHKGMREWQVVTEIAALAEELPTPTPVRSSPPPKRPPSKRENSSPRRSRPTRSATPPPLPAVNGADAKPAGVTGAEVTGAEAKPAEATNADAKAPSVVISPSESSSRMITPKIGRRLEASSPFASERPQTVDVSKEPAPSKQRALPGPRPAAGRPPTPDEPVAKDGPPLPGNDPAALVVAAGLSQAMLNPTIQTQREPTQPARARLSPAELRAAVRQPNLLLWVLGAGGWVLAGILAGMMLSRGSGEAKAPTSTTLSTARTAAQPEVAREIEPVARQPEPPAPPEPAPPPEPTAAATLEAPAKPVAPPPVVRLIVKSAAPAPTVAAPAPTGSSVLNTPGF